MEHRKEKHIMFARNCLVTREAQTPKKKKKTPRPHICNVFTQVLTPARRCFLVETRRDDRCLWEGLQEPLACRGTGLTASYFGGVACHARHEPQVDRDDFYFIFSSSFKALYWRQKKASLSARVRVRVCVRACVGCGLFYGEERVCLHCAVLRVAPFSTHVAESGAPVAMRFLT